MSRRKITYLVGSWMRSSLKFNSWGFTLQVNQNISRGAVR